MTLEDGDRRFSDPEVARKLAQLRVESRKDPFPLPRIEGLALIAQERLDSLQKSLTQEELDEVSGNDTLSAMYENDRFVVDRIVPLVYKLLERTQRQVLMMEGLPFGYSYYEDEDDRHKVCLSVEDVRADFFTVMDDSLSMQEGWDMAPPSGREGMKVFASMNKGEIIDRFLEFTQEYV